MGSISVPEIKNLQFFNLLSLLYLHMQMLNNTFVNLTK